MAKTRRNQPKPKRPAEGSAGTTSPASTTSPAATTRSAAPPRPTSDPRVAERIEQQRLRAAARQQQDQTRQMVAIAVSAAAALIVVGGIIWLLTRQSAPVTGRQITIAGAEHIPDTQKATDHNSVPPTSGQHYARTAPDGIQAAPVPDEVQVHNLEHGQIMIQYTCACPDLAQQLAVFAQRYPKWVLVAPYPNPNVGARIALTAWGYLDTFDEFDEARITNFIEARKNKGPEKVIME